MKNKWHRTTGRITLESREEKSVTCYKNDAYPGLFIHKDTYWHLTHATSGIRIIGSRIHIKTRKKFLEIIDPVFQYNWDVSIEDIRANPEYKNIIRQIIENGYSRSW